MFDITHLNKMIISKEIEEKINKKLNDKKKLYDWSSLDLGSVFDNIDIEKLNKTDSLKQNEIYQNISKLSIDLYLDYDHYKDFSFQNKFSSLDYENKLRMLGYKKHDSLWVSDKKPDKTIIIETVFMSCLYQSIVTKLNDTTAGRPENRGTINEQTSEIDCNKSNQIKKPLNEKKNKIIIDRKSSKNNIEKEKINSYKNSEWKCVICQSINPETHTQCMNKCVRAHSQSLWECAVCHEMNESTIENCAGCGQMSGRKFCDNCRNNEIIFEGLCGECYTAREAGWDCWYQLCGNRNYGSHKYCSFCGINRYAIKNHGAPLWRSKDEVTEKVWICHHCWQINNIRRVYCDNNRCNSYRSEYCKWCDKCEKGFSVDFNTYKCDECLDFL